MSSVTSFKGLRVKETPMTSYLSKEATYIYYIYIYFLWFTVHQLPGIIKRKFKSLSNYSQISQILQIWHVARNLRWADTSGQMYQKEHEVKGIESEAVSASIFRKQPLWTQTKKVGGVCALALRPSPHQSLVTAAHRDSKALSPYLGN